MPLLKPASEEGESEDGSVLEDSAAVKTPVTTASEPNAGASEGNEGERLQNEATPSTSTDAPATTTSASKPLPERIAFPYRLLGTLSTQAEKIHVSVRRPFAEAVLGGPGGGGGDRGAGDSDEGSLRFLQEIVKQGVKYARFDTTQSTKLVTVEEDGLVVKPGNTFDQEVGAFFIAHGPLLNYSQHSFLPLLFSLQGLGTQSQMTAACMNSRLKLLPCQKAPVTLRTF